MSDEVINQINTLDWKPRLRGANYCSPACGGNCTKADYEAVVAQAAKAVKLLGPGWEPHVWESFGWFYDVRYGGTTVSGIKTYTAFINDVPGGGGIWAEHGNSPREALCNAIAAAKADIARRTAALANAERGLKLWTEK